jgi:hypothetical protein
MAKKFESLNKTFNTKSKGSEIEPTSGNAAVVPDVVENHKKEDDRSKEIENDYKYTRRNLYTIIEKGQDALDSALAAAQEADSPRNYEVVSQLIKSVSDASDKLMALQKNMIDIQGERGHRGPTTVNNSVFLGSTAELAKFIKSSMAPVEEIVPIETIEEDK